MNIKQAKEEIKNAVKAYLTKDEYGQYVIPVQRQRPVFLLGAPGIGKTAIMEQIAQELGISLVSYSMTHHTRQSALGLPFIVKKTYGGKEYDVSEYTMSEIIASVHDVIEETGIQEGILFLDETNCVSETLAPAMLEFLQYKTFGRHQVPEGWIVATAGNPPEYNNSVHEYDIVTWDRLKKIEVEADFSVWKEYAYERGIHAAIIGYLDVKPDHFYQIESTADGKHFVTARGWEDLSDMIKLYEANGIPVDLKLISQYVQIPKTAREFAAYLLLYQKYKADYEVEKILKGDIPDKVLQMVDKAAFDERLSLTSLLMDYVDTVCRSVIDKSDATKEIYSCLMQLKIELVKNVPLHDAVDGLIKANEDKIRVGKASSSLSKRNQDLLRACNQFLSDLSLTVQGQGTGAFKEIKKAFEKRRKQIDAEAKGVSAILSNLFAFADNVMKDAKMTSIIVTEMTVRNYVSTFVSRYGCPEYFDHNDHLLFYEREKQIKEVIDLLDLGDIETPQGLIE